MEDEEAQHETTLLSLYARGWIDGLLAKERESVVALKATSMTSRTLVIVWLLALVLWSPSGLVLAPQPRLEKFINEKHRCSIYYSPETWNFQLQSSQRNDVAIFTAKDDSDTVAVLNMFDRISGIKLDPKQLYEMDKPSIREIFGGMEIIEERVVRLAGADAHLVIFNGKIKRVTRYTVVNDGFIYLLGYLAPRERYEKRLADFRTMVDTFTFIRADGSSSAPRKSSVEPSAEPPIANALDLSTRPDKVFMEESGGTVNWLYDLIVKNPANAEIEILQASLRYKSGDRTIEEVKLDADMVKQLAAGGTTRIAPEAQWAMLNNSGHREAAEKIDRIEYSIMFRQGGGGIYHQNFAVRLEPYQQKTRLMLPFNGIWRVAQGHDVLETHRQAADGQTFAYDFVYEVAGKDRSVTGRKPVGGFKLGDFFAFGRKVLAPAGGKVVRAVDGEEDVRPTFTRPPYVKTPKTKPYRVLGNYIVIDHANGEFSLLAHLKKGSVRVKRRDVVRQGQVIAECGNSGSSIQPHVHYQLMDGPDHFKSHGLPGKFSNYRSWRGVKASLVKLGNPVLGERVERIAAVRSTKARKASPKTRKGTKAKSLSRSTAQPKQQ